jgi:zinc protease
MGNVKIDGDAVAAIASAYEKSSVVAVSATEQLVEAKFGYTDFGPAGVIKEQKHIDDLDLTLVTFANGVHLNLKKTDFEANQIHVGIRIGNGLLTEPKGQPGLGFFSSSTFSAGGLGKHSVDDLERILAGKTVGAEFRVGGDALSFGGATNREDLLLQLQLLAAYIIDPGYRPESIRVAQKGFEQLYLKLDHTPNGPLQRDVPALLASGDPRFGLPPKASLLARSLDEERAWLAPQLGQGAIEIALVGDLDVDATIAAVGRTFGALPPRTPKPALESERKVSFPASFAKELTVPTEIPKGMVALYWPTTDARDVKLVRRLRLLTDIFSDRLRVKIREQLGESYSPQAASNPSETYRNYGLIYAMITVAPDKADQIVTATLAIADDLVKNGATTDELERAKKPILTALRESARTNAYWLGAVLASAQEFPQRLDWCRSRYSDNEAITVAELNELAKTYLAPSRAFRIVVVPEKK